MAVKRQENGVQTGMGALGNSQGKERNCVNAAEYLPLRAHRAS